jgi:hypothetical protein
MDLEVDRIADVRSERHQRRIESFHMPDLQKRPAPGRGCDHFVGFSQRTGDGFLN